MKINKKGCIAIVFLLCTTLLFAILFVAELQKNSTVQNGNYTDQMKIPYSIDLNDSGANAVERQGDHVGSPYFYNMDFYNASSTENLSILPQFKTIQQTSWSSCGMASIMMVLNYYDKLGNYNEETLAAIRSDHSETHIGACLDQMIEMLGAIDGIYVETTYDYQENLDAIDMQWFREHIESGIPVIIGWNDWGGHWQVAIGYDTMGTQYEGDDVLIVADPFDTTDHNQDGYGVYSMERFLYNFTFYDFFGENVLADKCFLAVSVVDPLKQPTV